MSETVPLPLREDITLRKMLQNGEVSYILKDVEKQKYFRFDEAQYELIGFFDGSRNLSQLVELFNATSQKYEYDDESAEELYKSLKDNKLLKRSQHEENIALIERLKDEKRSKFLQAKGSMLLMRFHLVNPNTQFDYWIEKVRFLWHPLVVKGCLLFMLSALVLTLAQLSRFVADFEQVFFTMNENWLNFLGVWIVALVVIALHECGHGLTCKHFGGDIDDMGFLLLVMQPCLYCNVNDAWLFENKRHKIYVALAGIYTELLLAAFSAYIWLIADVNSILGTIAFVIMTMCTAQSLFFNLNPLVKFDGYYILSDAMEMPNLKQNSTTWFSWLLKTKIFRMDVEAPLVPTDREKRFYMIYGGLALLYISTMLGTIAFLGYGFIAESVGFWGVLFFIWLVAKIVAKLTNSWPRALKEWSSDVFWSKKHRPWTIGALILCSISLFTLNPRVRVLAPCESVTPKQVIHAPESGFVTLAAIDARHRPTVSPGEKLFQLYSPELQLELEQAQAEVQGFQLQIQAAEAEGESAEARRLKSELVAARENYRYLVQRQQKLEITLPEGDWLVEAMPVSMIQGRFYGQGEEMVKLRPATEQLMDIGIEQADRDLIQLGQLARIRLQNGDLITGTVQTVAPMAEAYGPDRKINIRVQTQSSPIPEELTCQAVILAEERLLWEHLWRPVRKMLRAELFI